MVKLIKKWFFPPTFSILFYPMWLFGYFLIISEWDRSWLNFLNWTVCLTALYSIFYLALDSSDGRFTNFINFIESQKRYLKHFYVCLIFIIYFVLIGIVLTKFSLDLL